MKYRLRDRVEFQCPSDFVALEGEIRQLDTNTKLYTIATEEYGSFVLRGVIESNIIKLIKGGRYA